MYKKMGPQSSRDGQDKAGGKKVYMRPRKRRSHIDSTSGATKKYM